MHVNVYVDRWLSIYGINEIKEITFGKVLVSEFKFVWFKLFINDFILIKIIYKMM